MQQSIHLLICTLVYTRTAKHIKDISNRKIHLLSLSLDFSVKAILSNHEWSVLLYVYFLTAPDKAPTIISVTPHTTTSVLLRWKVMLLLPLFTDVVGIALLTIMSLKHLIKTDDLLRYNLQTPSEEQINGILLGFRIRYRELHYDRLRTFTVRTINNPMANWAELTGEHQDGIVFRALLLLSSSQKERVGF